MPGLMLLAVEDIAIEDHVYYDNRFGLVLPSGCRLPSPASVSFCKPEIEPSRIRARLWICRQSPKEGIMQHATSRTVP